MKEIKLYIDSNCKCPLCLGTWSSILKYNNNIKQFTGRCLQTSPIRILLLGLIETIDFVKYPCIIHIHIANNSFLDSIVSTVISHGSSYYELLKKFYTKKELHIIKIVKEHNTEDIAFINRCTIQSKEIFNDTLKLNKDERNNNIEIDILDTKSFIKCITVNNDTSEFDKYDEYCYEEENYCDDEEDDEDKDEYCKANYYGWRECPISGDEVFIRFDECYNISCYYEGCKFFNINSLPRENYED